MLDQHLLNQHVKYGCWENLEKGRKSRGKRHRKGAVLILGKEGEASARPTWLPLRQTDLVISVRNAVSAGATKGWKFSLFEEPWR